MFGIVSWLQVLTAMQKVRGFDHVSCGGSMWVHRLIRTGVFTHRHVQFATVGNISGLAVFCLDELLRTMTSAVRNVRRKNGKTECNTVQVKQ